MSDMIAAIMIVCPIWVVMALIRRGRHMPYLFYSLQLAAGLLFAIAFTLPSALIAHNVTHGSLWRALLAGLLALPAVSVAGFADRKFR